MKVPWHEGQRHLFRAILKIANYTGFSKEEIMSWTADEIQDALEFIKEETQTQNSQYIALIEYYILNTRKYQKKVGSGKKSKVEFDRSTFKKAMKQADKIKQQLTGQKPKKTNPVNVINNKYRVVSTMTVEEYKKTLEQEA